MRSYWKPALAGVVGVIIGVIGWQVCAHLWTDHQTLHQIVFYLNQNAQKATGVAK